MCLLNMQLHWTENVVVMSLFILNHLVFNYKCVWRVYAYIYIYICICMCVCVGGGGGWVCGWVCVTNQACNMSRVNKVYNLSRVKEACNLSRINQIYTFLESTVL